LSTRSIVKKNRRKPQTSQDKAVATNYHSRQTSGKTKTVNFSLFFSARRRQGFGAPGAGFIENFKDGLWIFPGASK
jgi:hypothetical protein